jgi:hypothetical protein
MDTTNSATNHPMKALNESMGYVVRDQLVTWHLPTTAT